MIDSYKTNGSLTGIQEMFQILFSSKRKEYTKKDRKIYKKTSKIRNLVPFYKNFLAKCCKILITNLIQLNKGVKKNRKNNRKIHRLKRKIKPKESVISILLENSGKNIKKQVHLEPRSNQSWKLFSIRYSRFTSRRL